MFMFDDVPDPVWKTSIGNWSSYLPRLTAAAASWMALAMSLSSTPRRPLIVADTPLNDASAPMRSREMCSPEIGKLSTARCVCAPHLASSGTRTSPMVSCSTRMPATLSTRVVSVTEFLYQDMLPLGPDDTSYRLLTTEGVSTFEADGHRFLRVDPHALTLLTAEAMREIAHYLRPAHLQQLRAILDDDDASENDRFVALDLLKNA